MWHLLSHLWGLIPNHQLFIKAMLCLSIGDSFPAGAVMPIILLETWSCYTGPKNIATFHNQNRVVTHPTIRHSWMHQSIERRPVLGHPGQESIVWATALPVQHLEVYPQSRQEDWTLGKCGILTHDRTGWRAWRTGTEYGGFIGWKRAQTAAPSLLRKHMCCGRTVGGCGKAPELETLAGTPVWMCTDQSCKSGNRAFLSSLTNIVKTQALAVMLRRRRPFGKLTFTRNGFPRLPRCTQGKLELAFPRPPRGKRVYTRRNFWRELCL